MNIEQLDEAMRLKVELAEWKKALTRAQYGNFKSAELIVTDAGHGHMGQQAQSKIVLDRDVLVPFLTDQIAVITARLKAYGVEV